MSRIAIIFLLLSLPARGATLWHLCRDTPTWRLSLLSPSPLIHVSLPPYYRWEGTASTFEAEYRGPDLVLTIHRDWAQTAWWLDFRVVQKPDGQILACWYSTGNDTVVFAHFASFREAWQNQRFRRSLQPTLCQLHQYLPWPDDGWAMIEFGL